MRFVDAAIVRHVALSALLVSVGGCAVAGQATGPGTPAGGSGQAVRHQVERAGATDLRGAYTFRMQVDRGGTCGWPVTSFMWPVKFVAASHAQDVLVGSLVFPPTASTGPSSWTIRVSPTGIDLLPTDGSPGAAAAAYDLEVGGGRWVAGGLTRADDGRQEIEGGTATGVHLVLVLPGSDRRWECRADVAWSLVTRFIDND